MTETGGWAYRVAASGAISTCYSHDDMLYRGSSRCPFSSRRENLTSQLPREFQPLVHFYPSDAMLAPVLAVALCLSVCVCLSQVGVLSKVMNGLIWFSAWVFFDQSNTVF